MAPITTIFFFILDSLNFLLNPSSSLSHYLASDLYPPAFSPVGQNTLLYGVSTFL
ncbi:hypothetical protein SLEP1_g15228 [Rubroshorea leprosula]|uniref:Uncharacterized protein n=1 Tax=Rubroshorea leprosula TaxID=152421 RepID=A0AAV5ISK4_9ROSI|nr:hypothetical protein SLEP1_g15228 [Rubroshorea leprosula]